MNSKFIPLSLACTEQTHTVPSAGSVQIACLRSDRNGNRRGRKSERKPGRSPFQRREIPREHQLDTTTTADKALGRSKLGRRRIPGVAAAERTEQEKRDLECIIFERNISCTAVLARWCCPPLNLAHKVFNPSNKQWVTDSRLLRKCRQSPCGWSWCSRSRGSSRRWPSPRICSTEAAGSITTR